MKQKGFTLIELLVVISIIGLLASVVLIAINGARAKARDAKRYADIAQIQKALELYYDANGRYPTSNNGSGTCGSGGDCPNSVWSSTNAPSGSWAVLQGLLSLYIAKLPKDPLENNNINEWGAGGYHYSYFSWGYGCDGQQYMLVFTVEKATRPDAGITFCDGTFFAYGSTNTPSTILTVGARAK